MNREETLALYEQGVEAWNKWANELLEERKRIEEAGEWEVKELKNGFRSPINDKTKAWFHITHADFSDIDTPHEFQNDANFSHFIFPGKTNFRSAIFNGKTYFNNAVFKENAGFNDITFNGDTWFDMVRIKGIVSFVDTVFNRTAMFGGSKFQGHTFFGNSEFNSNASFKHSTFKRSVVFNTVIFKNFTTFEGAIFHESAFFTAINSESFFTLDSTKFEQELPEFIQANFKEAPRLDNIKFGNDVPPGSFKNSITTFIDPDIKASYQALKRLAIQAHDHENEQRFWAGELRSDRSLRTEDGGWNLRPLYSAFWWGNIAYGCVSDYGRSIVRPIGALLILICLMTGLHLTKSKTPLTYDQAFSAGYIAANKSFLYLGTDPTKRSIIKEKYSALYGANENQTPKIPKTILTAEFFQTLLSAIFIFLALLGIRNNFKMK